MEFIERSSAPKGFAGWLILASSAFAFVLTALATLTLAAAAPAAEPGSLGNPVDRFDSRRQIGEQGLVTLLPELRSGSGGGPVVQGSLLDLYRLDVLQADGPPELVSQHSGPQRFGEKIDYATGTNPRSVADGDFNGDGYTDLAVANLNSNNVSIMLGTNAGSFGTKSDVDTGTNPYSVITADFNNDRRLDLAVANSGASTVSVLLGDGSGGFGSKSDFPAGTQPWSVTSNDFNADGNPDLAVANYGSNTVSVLLGNGSGGFGGKLDFDTGNQPWSVTSKDFNADDKPDLAVANGLSRTVSVLLGNGNGGFGPKADFNTGTNPFSVTSNDFNADRRPDLAVANYGSGTVSVLLNNGSGGFPTKTDFLTGTGPDSVTSNDFNADGKPDLAVTNYSSNTVSVLLGNENGDGGFGTKTDVSSGSRPDAVTSNDFNADGKPDLAFANDESGNVSVLFQVGSEARIPVADSARAAMVEADLDEVMDPVRGRLRPTLDPGIAFAGAGITSDSCSDSDFCLTWLRASHSPSSDHRFTGLPQGERFGLPLTGAPTTKVAIASATMQADVGPSLVAAWVRDVAGEHRLRVVHVKANRDEAGRVTGLQLVGSLDLGRVYSDPNLGDAKPSLAVGDFNGDGAEEVAVAWAPVSSSEGLRQYSAALLDAEPDGSLSFIEDPQTINAKVTNVTSAQVGPGVAAVGEVGTARDRLMVAPGIQGDGTIVWLAVGESSFDARPYDWRGPTDFQDQGKASYSDLSSLGDLDGDGVDELLASVDSGIHVSGHSSYGPVNIVRLIDDGQSAGTYVKDASGRGEVSYTQGLQEVVGVAVLDARRTANQSIVPTPGKSDANAMPQVVVAFKDSGGTGGCAGESYFPTFAFVSIDDVEPGPEGLRMVPRGPNFGRRASWRLDNCAQGPLSMMGFALDGRFELGDPIKKEFRQLEPSVVLNAPPTHFDVLGGQAYDVNSCYAGNECSFSSAYQREDSASTEVTSQSTESWDVSAKLTAEVSVFDLVNLSAEIRGGYGKNFEEVGGTTTTDTVSVTVNARKTDKIFAIRRAYDTLEYPFYKPGTPQPQGFLLAITPHTLDKRWIDSSSPEAADLMVNHQPGNILSYPENGSQEENPFISPTLDLSGGLVGPSTFARDQFEISGDSDYTYSLTQARSAGGRGLSDEGLECWCHCRRGRQDRRDRRNQSRGRGQLQKFATDDDQEHGGQYYESHLDNGGNRRELRPDRLHGRAIRILDPQRNSGA